MTAPLILLFENSRSLVANLRLMPRLEAHGMRGMVVSLSAKRNAFYQRSDIASSFLDAVSVPSGLVNRGAEIVRALEQKFPDFRLDLAIRRDRFLRWRSRRLWRQRLFAVVARFDSILDETKPSLVVGEVSTAIEYALYFLCESRGLPYRHLLNLPTKEPRITLFDYCHSAEGTLYLGAGYVPRDTGSFGINYFDLGARRTNNARTRWTVWRDFLEVTYSSQDYRTSVIYKGRYFFHLLYALFYWLLEKVFATSADDAKGGVLLALHVQPESTPDYVSIYYADQIMLAFEIADNLPIGVQLVLKEHPHVLSARNPFRLTRLLMRKNVKLLRRKTGIRDLLKNFSCLVTIAGTVAVEAASAGTPTIVYSESFLKCLPNVVDGRLYASFSEAYAIATKNGREEMKSSDVEAFMSRLGIPGLVYDWTTMPEMLDDEYVDAIATCMVRFVQLSKMRRERSVPSAMNP